MTVYIVRWTPRASSYPYLQVFATEELAKASKWYGDDDPRNYSKSIEKQEVIGLTTENMNNFDLKKYLAEGKLLKEDPNVIKNLSKSKTFDVIDGDQYFLNYEDGSTFGSTTQNTDHKVLYTQTKAERDLIKQIGKSTSIRMINKYYGLNIEDVL